MKIWATTILVYIATCSGVVLQEGVLAHQAMSIFYALRGPQCLSAECKPKTCLD